MMMTQQSSSRRRSCTSRSAASTTFHNWNGSRRPWSYQPLVKESVARVSRRALLRKRWNRRTRTRRAAGAAPFSFLVMEFLIIASLRRGPVQACHRLSLAAPAPLFFSPGGSAGSVQLFTCMRQAVIEEESHCTDLCPTTNNDKSKVVRDAHH
ncbi:unnamed protein product [Sphagnum jensenii]